MPWIVDFGLSVGYERSFGWADFQAKLSVYNVFNRQEPVWVYQELEPGVGDRDPYFGKERFLQGPRYGQLTLSLGFLSPPMGGPPVRPVARRVGKEVCRTLHSRWLAYPYNK